jgi:ribonuclease PH
VALVLALQKLQTKKVISKLPPLVHVAAVSVGVVKGQICVDLDYVEDSSGEVDLNIVALDGGKLVEVQGTAENGSFDRAQLDQMLDAGLATTQKLIELQKKILG